MFVEFRDNNADLSIRYTGPHEAWNGITYGGPPSLEVFIKDPNINLSVVVEKIKNCIFMHTMML